MLGEQVSGDRKEAYEKAELEHKIRIVNNLRGLTASEKITGQGRREQIDETTRKIAGVLREAVKWDMHTLDLKFETQPGIEINVPRYINGLAKFYEIALPDAQ